MRHTSLFFNIIVTAMLLIICWLYFSTSSWLQCWLYFSTTSCAIAHICDYHWLPLSVTTIDCHCRDNTCPSFKPTSECIFEGSDRFGRYTTMKNKRNIECFIPFISGPYRDHIWTISGPYRDFLIRWCFAGPSESQWWGEPGIQELQSAWAACVGVNMGTICVEQPMSFATPISGAAEGRCMVSCKMPPDSIRRKHFSCRDPFWIFGPSWTAVKPSFWNICWIVSLMFWWMIGC